MPPSQAGKSAPPAAGAPPATMATPSATTVAPPPPPEPLIPPTQLTRATNSQMTAAEPNQLERIPEESPEFTRNYFQPLNESTGSATWLHRPSSSETPLLPAATAPTGTDEAVTAGPDPTLQQRERCGVGLPGQGNTGRRSFEIGSGSIFSLSALHPKTPPQHRGKRQRPCTPNSLNPFTHAPPPSAEKLL